ncbi:uncharacterized protein [Bemisia tabaci]|uniref:uncharacterized protein n=1 Tax=Bemisia tabaci TaxID=7038 RepID=UPI003B283DB8
MSPYFYIYILRLVAEASANYGVDPNASGGGIPWDVDSCQVQCDSLWGRVPQLNVPWAQASVRDDCACRFNSEKLQSFESQTCIQRYFWLPLEKKKKLAEMKIKAKVARMSAEQQFAVFKRSYGKMYSSKEEEDKRLEIFKGNLVVIKNLMATATGNLVYGMGPYTDRTSEEFQTELRLAEVNMSLEETPNLEVRMLNNRGSRGNWSFRRARSQPPTPTPAGPKPPPFGFPPGYEPPDYKPPPPPRSNSVPPNCKYLSPWFLGKYPQGGPLLDWRVPAEYYPAIESQSLRECDCGSCWAFAPAAAVEIFLARVQGEVTTLSKQALLDCIPGDGCKGGKVWTALEYMKNTGLPSSDAYPYKAKKGRCRKNVQPYAKIREWGVVTPDPESHESWLPNSPIATNMLAPVEFQHYVSGVFDVPQCGNVRVEDLNHSVVIVGHFRDAWIVRNSFTSDWGIKVCNILIGIMLRLG